MAMGMQQRINVQMLILKIKLAMVLQALRQPFWLTAQFNDIRNYP